MVIFATIFGVGFLVLLISIIFGHDTDVHVDADASGVDTHGPGVVSVKMIALMMVGFGAFGFGTRATTDWSMFKSSMAGLVGAAAVGVAGYLILRLFYSSQESSTISDEDIVGQQANLIDAVAGSDYGQAACVIRGREITFLARSVNGESISKHTPVRIVRKSGNVVTVEPYEQS